MSVKMSRYLTHIRRLADAQEPVEQFLGRARGLGPKLGPVLFRLPPSLRVDAARLRDTLELFPDDVRVAVEVRHESWETDQDRRILTDHGAALCLADRRGPLRPDWVTAGWGYVRFHEGRASPRPCYGPDALETWAQRIVTDWGRDADVFVYFNNDTLGVRRAKRSSSPRLRRQWAPADAMSAIGGRRLTRGPLPRAGWWPPRP